MTLSKISIRQIKAARALLDWSQEQLAEEAGASLAKIKQLQAEDAEIDGSSGIAIKLVAAFDKAGISFIEENGEAVGVRLKSAAFAAAEAADIASAIAAIDEKLATINIDGEPSPEIGMNLLKKAHVQNERTKLKNRRAKIRKG
ncbi:hypothetical protein Msil_2645 [Methylocella silvestris BL2]|uniref:HTH cro/C1-type domain-containing protein n=1 Tax=Methylocella silvestris (strain DSM 15510 / CIP 108128 / LMG 27833 / NCIMB 13906 / BL2) TaxID=395965 RepID=B8EQ78_METSB|nr:hypothetical protein [Methylocella silvestris]ACK51568.1 hypothetical protein Msil_2645 [Methylocella silvestris BL2]